MSQKYFASAGRVLVSLIFIGIVGATELVTDIEAQRRRAVG